MDEGFYVIVTLIRRTFGDSHVFCLRIARKSYILFFRCRRRSAVNSRRRIAPTAVSFLKRMLFIRRLYFTAIIVRNFFLLWSKTEISVDFLDILGDSRMPQDFSKQIYGANQQQQQIYANNQMKSSSNGVNYNLPGGDPNSKNYGSLKVNKF